MGQKFCPQCNSKNVVPNLSKEMIAWGGSTHWVCKDCGYSSPLFPEGEKKRSIQKHNSNKKKDIKKSKARTEMRQTVPLNRWASWVILLILFVLPLAAILIIFIIYTLQNK